MSFAKLALKRALLDAPQVSEEEWIRSFVSEYFPTSVRTRYADRLKEHLLAREISITVICNKVINQAGVSFLAGMEELEPLRVREAVGLYLAFDQILQGDRWRDAVRALDGKLTADRQYELLLQLESALNFLCRWAWEHGRRLTPVPEMIEAWRADLRQYLMYLGQSPEFTLLTSAAPEASRLLFLNRLRDFPALVNLSRSSHQNLASVAKAFDDLVKFLGLRQIVTLMSEVKVRDLWERRLQTALDDQFRSATGRLVRMELHSNIVDPVQFFHDFTLDSRLARFLKLRGELMEEPLATLEPFAALAAELESLTDACGAATGLY
jgi:glutamate dehydrogenase